MSLTVHIASLLLGVLLSCHEADTAVTAFTSKPSDLTLVEEKKPVTLVWDYTLGGSITVARFLNVTGGGNERIASRSGGGNTSVVDKYQDRFEADISNTQARLTILTVQRSDQGKYEFDLLDVNVDNIKHTVEVIVQFPPNFRNVSLNQTVHESSSLQLFCEASGSPAPIITWTRRQDGSNSDVLHRGSTWNFASIRSGDAGTYRCTANNGVGHSVSHVLKVTVLFSPKVKLENQSYVGREQTAFLHCQAEGYPLPTITWTPCNPPGQVCDTGFLNISKVQMDAAFTCTVINNLGNVSASTNLVIGAKAVNLTLSITLSEKCIKEKYDQAFSKKLEETVNKLFESESSYSGTTVLDVRCGSVIVDLTVQFTSVVSETWVLSVLRNATKDGRLEEFNVNASSIIAIPPVIKSTTMPPMDKTTPSSSGDDNVAIICGAVFGTLAVIAIIVVVVWFVRKKNNKCKKGTKEVCDDETAVQANPSSGPHGQSNGGYDKSASASGYANPSSVPPGAAQKGKKENKEHKKGKDGEKPVAVYAQIDQSKRKPKQPVSIYDKVERENRKKPGEIQYAELDDLPQRHSMPRDSTSQTRKPPSYAETEYAEVII